MVYGGERGSLVLEVIPKICECLGICDPPQLARKDGQIDQCLRQQLSRAGRFYELLIFRVVQHAFRPCCVRAVVRGARSTRDSYSRAEPQYENVLFK